MTLEHKTSHTSMGAYVAIANKYIECAKKKKKSDKYH